MIQIPITLTSLDYSRPLIWNGTSLEFGALTFLELTERIQNLRKNRSATVAMVNKIKLDLGKVRRFDFFSLESNLKMIEVQLTQIIPLLTHLNYSQENMDERIRSYNSLVALINELYLKFKDAGLPILESVKAQKSKVLVLQKRLQLMSNAVESMTIQEIRMGARLRSIDGRMRGINGKLSKLFASLYVLSSGNFELSGVVAEISSYESVVRTKIDKAVLDLDELIRRVCDINIAMLQLLSELAFLELRLKSLEDRSAAMKSDLKVAETTLNKLQENLDILRDFYNVAKSKLQSIENYLATFIVGGENVYLDFGENYTVVNVIPPPMPPCLPPEPCPTSAPTPPTQAPTQKPTAAPTAAPTQKPTSGPTQKPTSSPTAAPTAAPTQKPEASGPCRVHFSGMPFPMMPVPPLHLNIPWVTTAAGQGKWPNGNIGFEGSYPSLSDSFGAAVSGTLDGILISAGTKLTIYSEKNFAGSIVLEEYGPMLINNAGTTTSAIMLSENYPEFPVEKRVFKSGMHAWGYKGSCKISCSSASAFRPDFTLLDSVDTINNFVSEKICSNISTTINNVGNWRFAQPTLSLNLGCAANSNDFEITNSNDFSILVRINIQLLIAKSATVEFLLYVDDKLCKVSEIDCVAIIAEPNIVVMDGTVRIEDKANFSKIDCIYYVSVPKNSTVGIITKAKVFADTNSDVSINGISYTVANSDTNIIFGAGPNGGRNVWNSYIENNIELEQQVPIITNFTEPDYQPGANKNYTNSLSETILGAFVLTKNDSIVYVDCYHDSVSREESLQELKNARMALEQVNPQTQFVPDTNTRFLIEEVTDPHRAKFIYDNL